MALKLGCANPGELADSLTDSQWLTWKAVALIDGWFNGWSQTAEIVSQLNNLGNRIELMHSAKPAVVSQQQKWFSGYEFAEKITDFGKKKPKRFDVAGFTKRLMSIEASKTNGKRKS